MRRIFFTLSCLLAYLSSAWTQANPPNIADYQVADGIPPQLAETIIKLPDSTEIAVAIVKPDGSVAY